MADRLRPRIPEYPRPVPYVCPDEAPICPDTIVYERWTDEAEDKALKRSSKRRRLIQDAAASYLREEPVCILSASLKGPFDDGWKNPWAQKRQPQDAEVPETTAKEALWRKSLAAIPATADQRIVVNPEPIIQQPPGIYDEEPENVFKARSHTALAEDRPSRRSAKKVAEWLRKTEDQANKPHIDVRSSPTPVLKPYINELVVERHDSQIRIQDDEEASEPPERSLPNIQTATVPKLYDRSPSSEPSHESPQRAELAILEHKRLSVHKVPPSTHLPEFEYRRPRSRRGKPVGAQSGRDESALAIMAPQQSPHVGRAQSTSLNSKKPADKSKVTGSEDRPAGRPDLSTETSKTSTIHQYLPSAQVIAAPSLSAMPLHGQSTLDLLHSVPPASSKDAAEAGSSGMDKAARDAEKENQPGGHANAECTPEAEEAPAASLEKTPVRELETQEMIAAIKPFEISTIKRPLKPTAERPTPLTGTRATKTRKQKKASFALSSPPSDGSQKSIKAGMRITKVASGSSLARDSSKRLTLPSMDSYVEVLCSRKQQHSVDDSLPSVSAMFGSKEPNALKGILKSSVVTSTCPIPPGTNTTSTSLKQEAQQIPEPPVPIVGAAGAMDEDDDFDLDGAMDELGSYLGTWDADVEASKLAA